jgi:hypothetical protein
VLATLADGRIVALDRAPLAGVRGLHMISARSGYRVALEGDQTVRLVRVAPQSSEPDPGPTAVVRVARTLGARITVDP